ncbi:hypothetical protein B0H13DRAFT_1907368 [Mycena leptocephala]|nr:hypothetical protein B0H13DRAFT_1907368 [Mycena leptocephala]
MTTSGLGFPVPVLTDSFNNSLGYLASILTLNLLHGFPAACRNLGVFKTTPYQRGPGATDPLADTIYLEPLYEYEYESLTEAQLHQVIAKMKPWKATRSKTFPNCVYKHLSAQASGLETTETIVGRKPGKPNYTALQNGGKNLQLATNAEYFKMLPNNYWGGRPGRTGVDMDIKGAFPSAMLLRIPRGKGIPPKVRGLEVPKVVKPCDLLLRSTANSKVNVSDEYQSTFMQEWLRTFQGRPLKVGRQVLEVYLQGLGGKVEVYLLEVRGFGGRGRG